MKNLKDYIFESTNQKLPVKVINYLNELLNSSSNKTVKTIIDNAFDQYDLGDEYDERYVKILGPSSKKISRKEAFDMAYQLFYPDVCDIYIVNPENDLFINISSEMLTIHYKRSDIKYDIDTDKFQTQISIDVSDSPDPQKEDIREYYVTSKEAEEYYHYDWSDWYEELSNNIADYSKTLSEFIEVLMDTISNQGTDWQDKYNIYKNYKNVIEDKNTFIICAY